jgi:transposase
MTFDRHMRVRVLHLRFEVGSSCSEIATRLILSYTSVKRFIREYEQCGSINPPCDGHRRRGGLIPQEHMGYLLEHLELFAPDLYLDEMSELLYDMYEVRYKPGLIRAHLMRHGINRRVLRRRSVYRNEREIANFEREVCDKFLAHQLICCDESRKDPLSLYRPLGWGRRGTRTERRVGFTRATSGYSVFAVLALNGVVGFDICRSAGISKEVFIEQVRRELLPNLQQYPLARSVVIMDNAAVHCSPEIRAMIESTGAILILLPPYCPEFNPIEEVFSKLKAFLQRHRTLSEANPRLAITRGLHAVSHVDAAGYFEHAQYRVETIIPGFLYH